MLKFEKKNPKIYELLFNDNKIILELSTSSITNKFYIVGDFIEDVSKLLGEEFDDWFENLIKVYQSINNDYEKYKFLSKNLIQLKLYIDEYIKKQNMDFSIFVNEKKQKKTSIIFDKDEIEFLHKISSYLKIYSIFYNTENLKLPQLYHKKIFNEVISSNNGVVIRKIFDIVKIKTFRYNLTDRYMWEYIKMIKCKEIDVHIIEIFNFIMNNMLVLCHLDKNPITFFVSLIDDSINWLLRNVYVSKIVYDTELQSREVHSLKYDNLKLYACNNTIAKLKVAAYKSIFSTIEEIDKCKFKDDDSKRIDDKIVKLQTKIKNIKYLNPLIESIVCPILSKITDVPYLYLSNKTINNEQFTIISYFMSSIFKKAFNDKFINLFNLLEYYPESLPPSVTTFRMNNIDFALSIYQKHEFFGFESREIKFHLIKHFIGKIARLNFKNILTDEKIKNVSIKDIESESLYFYGMLWGNKLDEELKNTKELLLSKL